MSRVPVAIRVEDYDCPPSVRPRLRLLKHAWLYTTLIFERPVGVTFAANGSCDTHFQTVVKILRALIPQSQCVAPIRITVLLSDHRKVLPIIPGEVLDTENVNTGYARQCREIVVYREEEWCKVLIHECFHFFGFDKGASGSVADLFPVSVPIDLHETFCEVWARILNCALSGRVAACLERERKWACFQAVKVLDYMGLRYDDLLQRRRLNLYKENTNVFAYIILGAILLQDPRAFMLWSGGFNAPEGLATRVRLMHRTPQFLAEVAEAEQLYAHVKGNGSDLATTLRMSSG